MGNATISDSKDNHLSGYAVASGKISTSSQNLGGEITILGDKVGVIQGEITADGSNGGGRVLIGGEKKGQGTIPNAEITYISPDSQVSASATLKGNGGEIIAFADNHASIHGKLKARGGELGGDGGFVETSGVNSFQITTIPDTEAIVGQPGEWLIDPSNIEIVAEGEPVNINIFSPFEPTGDSAVLPVGLIQDGLQIGSVTVSTQSEGEEAGNIIWNSDAILNYAGIGADSGTVKTLTLEANRNIRFGGVIENQDTLSPDSLNVIFNSNLTGETGGAIALLEGSSINTNGGNIVLGGGSDPLNGFAVGTPDLLFPENIASTETFNNGVDIKGNLNGEGGNISIRGEGLSSSTAVNNVGVSIGGVNTVIINTRGDGVIDIQGIGGDGSAVDVDGNSNNIGILSAGGIIKTENGNINLIGNGGAGVNGDSGVKVTYGEITALGNGFITLDGTANNGVGFGLEIGSSANTLITTNGNGDINLVGNSNNRDGVSIGSSLTPSGQTTNITTNATGSINILGNTNIPNNDNQGIHIKEATFIQSVNNLQILSNGDILQDSQSQITAQGFSTIGAIIPSGEFSIPANISLIGTENDFNVLETSIANNLTVIDVNDLILSNQIISGNLEISIGNTLTQISESNISVSGNTSITTSDPNLADVNINNFNPSGTVLDEVLIGGNFTLNSAGEVTQTLTGKVQVAGETIINPSLDNLTNADNIINSQAGNIIDIDGEGNIFIRQLGIVNVSELLLNAEISTDITGNLTVISEFPTGNLAFNDSPITGGQVINLAGNFGNNLSITTTAPEVVPVTATLPGIIQTDAINVAGNTLLNATSQGDITLNQNNNFVGALSIEQGNNVSIRDVNTLNVGNSLVSGNLTLNTNGNLSDSGAINVSGLTTLNPNNNDIILDSVNNDFQTVNLRSGNNVILTDINDLTLSNDLGSINVLGDLDLRIANTNILNRAIQAQSLLTDSSGVTQISTSSITTTGNQTYNDPVILTRNTTITGDNITFNSSIDSSETPVNLNVRATNNLNYGDGIGSDRIGANIGLNNLQSRALNTFLNINLNSLPDSAVSIRTLGNQFFSTSSTNPNVIANAFLFQNTILEGNNIDIILPTQVDSNSSTPISFTVNAL